MDPVYLHLLLNHFSILGLLFGFALLLYGVLRKSNILEQTGLNILVLVAIITIPVFLTGEASEDVIENIPGVPEYYIELHEEWSEKALWAMMVTGTIALLGLVFLKFKPHIYPITRLITFVLAIATFSLMSVAAKHGGKIRHSELRQGDAPKSAIGSEKQLDSEMYDDD